jgi:tetratricopeptide (TPR) repeat protein
MTVPTDRASCLLGRCQPDAGTVPYLPFTEILRTVLEVREQAESGVLERTVARIREIGPELEEYIPLYLHLLSMSGPRFSLSGHLKGEALRLAIEEAIAALLTLKARHHPVVVLLEDWHWVDEASRSALTQVAEVVSAHAILLVVTCRSGYGVDWSTASRHTSVPLRPLDPGPLAALLESFLRVRAVPAGLGALLHQRTGGNPFFLEEMCKALLEQGALRIEGDEALATGPLQLLDLPDSIEAVIRTRLDRLDGPARDVLRLASVVGRDFTRVILERTVTDAVPLPQALETLRAAGLVRQTHVVPDVMYRFNHVLTQEVAYASLLEHQRRDLHGRVGAAIERLGQDRIDDNLDRLAHHFSRAHAWRKALQYGMRSAERAGALAQYMEALQILDRTQRWLINLPAGTERQDALLEILLRQERLCETLGQRGRQQRIIDELIRQLEPDGDAAMLAEAHLRQGDVCTLRRRFLDGEVALQRSLRIMREIGDEAGEGRALRSLGLLRWYQGRNQEALACIADVVEMDRDRNDTVALVGDLTSLAIVLKSMDQCASAKMRLEEGYDIAEAAIAAGSIAAGDLHVKQAYILNGLAILCREEGDLDAAVDYLARSEEIAEVRRLPVYLPYHHAVAAHIFLQQGRVEECLTRYRLVVEMARKVKYVPGLSQTLRIQAELLLGLNRYAEALPCLREAAGLFAQLEDREAEALMWSGVARACDCEEDHAGATAAWTRSRELRRLMGNGTGELEALEGLAAAARKLTDESSDALGYYHEALQLAHSLDDRAAEGRLRNSVGILEWNRGDFTQALPHYERAFTIFSELHDTANAGLMLNSIAITLKQLGQRAEAKRRFEDAVALHRETGEQQLEGHALAALGDISSEAGEIERAVEYYERSLEIRRDIGDRRGEGWMLYNLARNGRANRPEPNGELVALASEIALDCQDDELAVACEELRHTSG